MTNQSVAASALGLCKFQAATAYGWLSRLSGRNAVRRAEVMVHVARMAAFRAPVLWILRLAHATDDRQASMEQKATTPAICRSRTTSGSSRRVTYPESSPRAVAVSLGNGGGSRGRPRPTEAGKRVAWRSTGDRSDRDSRRGSGDASGGRINLDRRRH